MCRTLWGTPGDPGTCQSGIWPADDTRCSVGLRPKTPQKWEGTRTEPPRSLPMSKGESPAATAAAAAPTGRAPLVPGIAGRAKDRAVALVVRGKHGHVRLAQDDRARRAQARHDGG